jgi:hypothetical protein
VSGLARKTNVSRTECFHCSFPYIISASCSSYYFQNEKKRQYAPLKYQNLFPLVYGIKYQKHKIFDIFYLEGGGEEEGLGYLI